MQTEELLISIVTYNSKEMFRVLDNLRETLATSRFHRIVIFDNHSEPAYQDKLREYEDIADIHFHESNEGFGFGHNYNLLEASAPYYLILNPDVIITKQALEELLALIKTEPDIGLVVPRVLYPDGTPQYLIRERVSVFDYALRFVPFNWVKKLFDKRLASYECRDLPTDRVSQVRIGSGCCMLVRQEAFQAIGGFDPRYFMYFEDYDLCLELGKKNYRILYTPMTTIFHYYGKAAHKSYAMFKIFMRSMRQFFSKWGWKVF